MSEQEQRFLVLIAIDLGLMTFAVLGLAVWTGRWRGWTKSSYSDKERVTSLPWLALCLIIMRIGLFLKVSLGLDILDYAWIALSMVCLAIGVIVSNWRFPKWAFPFWYREYLRIEQSQKDREGQTAR